MQRLFLILLIFATSSIFGAERPWWDSFPRIIQDPLPKVVTHNGNIMMGGGGEDPFKGLYLQRQSTINAAKIVQTAKDQGIKKIVWYEGFGTAHSYIGQLKKDTNGNWIKNSTDPTWTQLFSSHNSWEKYDNSGVIRWIGITNHFENDPALQPWTRTHSKYGCPPMTYPDGRLAIGYIGTESTDTNFLFSPNVDQRTSRIFDAGCSKDVFGNVFFEYGYNASVNKIDPKTKTLVGPLTGLITINDIPIGTPDPGFTLEEWKKAKAAGYAGDIYCGKDIACPIWIDYLDASIRHALDEADIDGLWIDNFSPWDNFNVRPIQRAFGEWTVAGFRTFLTTEWKTKIPSEIIATIDPKTFDVRKYLLARYREWGGTGNSLKESMRNPVWQDPRWQNDPIWRAFLVYKRRIGTAGLIRYYETVKKHGAEAGKPDILVSGNDMPMFSLGWIRGHLDMVSTELSWGWSNTAGQRGLMPPPQGSYVPVYRLAREHAKSRFVNVWMYVPKDLIGKPNIGNVLHYQGLANHTMPKAQLTPRPYGSTAGTPEAVTEFFGFVKEIEPILCEREPISGKIGLFYSSSSQLFNMVPGMVLNFTNQEHSFSWFGWGTLLTKQQIPWQAIPEWKLTPQTLENFTVLVMPQVITLDDSEAELLQHWVENGGRLLLSGQFAGRHGEEKNFDQRTNPSPFLTTCIQAIQQGKLVPVKKGFILGQNNDPGLPYYKEENKRTEWTDSFLSLLEKIKTAGSSNVLPDYISVPKDFPFGVDITLHRDSKRLFIDLNNTQIDITTDKVTSSGQLRFEILVPKNWQDKKINTTVLSPHRKPIVNVAKSDNGRLAVEIDDILFYVCLVLEPQD